MYRYFATHFSMYCTAGIYNSILNQVGGRNTVLQQAFVHNGIPFVSDIPTIIFGADVSHPPPGMYSSSIAGVRFSLLLRICFCFTTMASYMEINILAHCIKNLKLNSTSLLLSPSNFFWKDQSLQFCCGSIHYFVKYLQVVGSIDWPEVTTYRAIISAQLERQEIIGGLFHSTRDPKGCLKPDGMIR